MVNWKQIKAEYEASSTITMKEIAEKHGVKVSTLRSRKNREKWQRKEKKNASRSNATQTEKVIAELDNNDSLSEQQKLFCLYYIQSFNATQSYMKAYKCSYETALASGSRLLANVKMKKELTRLKQEQQKELYIDGLDITRELAKQAFSDIGDYLDFGTEEVDVYDEGGESKTVKRSFVRLKEKEGLDTKLIEEVRVGRDGVVLKLYNKQNAMKELAKRLEAGDETETQIMKLFSKLGELVDGS